MLLLPLLAAAALGSLLTLLWMHVRQLRAAVSGRAGEAAAAPPPPADKTHEIASAWQNVLADISRSGSQHTKADPGGPRLTLVGAGPGAPELLTLAAVQAVDSAQLIVADRLIPPQTLALLCRRGQEVVVAQKEYGRAHVAQEEIYAACLRGLQRGWHVVRLKGGDPLVFGRGGEELRHFRALGYNVRLVPGVSSSLAAPLLAGIPVTHRGVADQLLIATAHGKEDTDPHFQPYSPWRTDVFMMGALRLASLARKLQSQYGFPADVPVAVIENASLPQQRQLVTVLSRVAAEAAAANYGPPSVIVVGWTVTALRG